MKWEIQGNINALFVPARCKRVFLMETQSMLMLQTIIPADVRQRVFVGGIFEKNGLPHTFLSIQ